MILSVVGSTTNFQGLFLSKLKQKSEKFVEKCSCRVWEVSKKLAVGGKFDGSMLRLMVLPVNKEVQQDIKMIKCF